MQGEALIVAAGLMGVAGLPHCAAMCAAPCAAVARGSAASQPVFQLARVIGYAAGGAVAAWSVGALREGLALAPVLRPLWTLLHLAALACGLWMLWRGQWPAWLERSAAPAPQLPGSWQRIVIGPARSACAGALWIAWPCALSQSALLVAALASTPQQGAAAMAVFATASSPALWLGPALMRRFGSMARGQGALTASWPVRTAGALIAIGSAMALTQGLWTRFVAWCA
jgi:sulfite exporter TauE/SafE